MNDQDQRNTKPPLPPVLRVRIEKGTSDKAEFSFTEPFRIGRDASCEVQMSDPTVSRFHTEIWFVEGRWWVLDLQSANGTYLNGKMVERAPLVKDSSIKLGIDGPILSLTIEGVSEAEETQMEHLSFTHYKEHYFEDSGGDKIGTHTMMIRRAFKQIQNRQEWRFAGIIAVLACLFVVLAIYTVLKHKEAQRQKFLAEDIFYAMKSLELEFAPFLKTARMSKDAQSLGHLKEYRARRQEMEQSYDQFIKTLEVYGKKIGEEERIILRMARTFGESEINMPRGFVDEVLTYVNKWRSTDRLIKAITRARKNGYTGKIAETMLAHNLPPQFFYLALQESDFRIDAVGPKTKHGIAKGIWQFIPSTAVYYGLRTGPLRYLRRADPRDERQDFEKSTLAAARYLRDIYDTEAQASGLLVIASYNWGERRIIELIRKMPENPRDRNFWRLLADYRIEIPRQTYDYVFYIISAAVIGENPELFGFDFDNPLAQIEEDLVEGLRGRS